MSFAPDEPIDLSDEDLEQMLEEAIDIIAMTMPEDASDEYWSTFRKLVEQRAAEMMAADDDEDDED